MITVHISVTKRPKRTCDIVRKRVEDVATCEQSLLVFVLIEEQLKRRLCLNRVKLRYSATGCEGGKLPLRFLAIGDFKIQRRDSKENVA